MSEDYERTAPRSDPSPGDTTAREAPMTGGDTAYEEVGYDRQGSRNPEPALGETDVPSSVTTSSTATGPGATAYGSTDESSTPDVAKDQAKQVGQEAVAGGQHVAGVTAEQDLASELGSMVDRSDASDTRPAQRRPSPARRPAGPTRSPGGWRTTSRPTSSARCRGSPVSGRGVPGTRCRRRSAGRTADPWAGVGPRLRHVDLHDLDDRHHHHVCSASRRSLRRPVRHTLRGLPR